MSQLEASPGDAVPADPDHRRLPGLDGLRGIAVLAVVLFHLGWLRSGFLGVGVFFVLSGFLITRILVAEVLGTGGVDLLRFTRRRLLRLYPALVAVVLFVVAVSVVTRRERSETLFDAFAALTYTGNFVHLHGLLDHVWTLGIEEQFYLVWPLLLVLTSRTSRRTQAVLLGGLIATMLGADLLHGQSGVLHTYVRATGLPVGCLLALWPALQIRIAAVGASSLLLLLACLALPLPGWLTTGWPMSVAALLTGPAVARYAMSTTGPLASSVLRYFGRRSYSLYLWHFPLISLAVHHAPESVPVLVGKALALGASLVAAELSFRFVESPVLRWRDRSLLTEART